MRGLSPPLFSQLFHALESMQPLREHPGMLTQGLLCSAVQPRHIAPAQRMPASIRFGKKKYRCLDASSTHEPYIAAFTPCSQAFAPIRMTSCGKDRKHRSLLPKPCGKARPCRRTASSSCQGKLKRAHDERAHFNGQRDNTRHASAETLKASSKPAQDAGAWSVR